MTETLAQAVTHLEETIAARRLEGADTSYTAQLLKAGPVVCAKKLGEEAIEAALAAATGDRAGLAREAADLIFHLLVTLAAADVPACEVAQVLAERRGRSGLEEKASRPS